MRVAIMQPTYLPWIGYFDLMDQVDCFVFLDDVQFAHRSWQHRNRIKSPRGLELLTVPVVRQGLSDQLILEARVAEPLFWRKHLRAVETNYARAPYFGEYRDELRGVFESWGAHGSLCELNLALVETMRRWFGITTELRRSSHLSVAGKRSERLLAICLTLAAREYRSPMGSADYLLDDVQLFRGSGVQVTFHSYVHPEYAQLYPPFVPYATALDLLFNEGPVALKILRSGRRAALSAGSVRAAFEGRGAAGDPAANESPVANGDS